MSEGTVLAGRYRLLDQVAVGAMGQVWRAHDDRLDRDVAVKVLRPELADDAGFLDRFRTEARHAASVRHPHVAAVHDYGEDEQVMTGGTATAYLVMDLLEGSTLGALLESGGPLPEERVARLLAQVADALAAAHRTGLVHRDVKPANLVLADATAGTGHEDVTVTDFGIARAADAVPVTRTGLVMGTAEYLSPEQARGARATPASDVYSLGVVAYELLTGRPPFTGGVAAEVARAHVHDAPPALPRTLSPAVRAAVERCLLKDPALRPDAAELAALLRAVAEGEPAGGSSRVDGGPHDRTTASAAAGDGTPLRPPVPDDADRLRPPLPDPPVDLPAAPPASAARGPVRDAGRPSGPVTRELPVAGPRPTAGPTAPPRPVPRRRRRWRSPLRAPAVALLALLALLLLATALQQAGLLGGDAAGAGIPSAAGTPTWSAATDPTAAPHVTGSPGTTATEDGR